MVQGVRPRVVIVVGIGMEIEMGTGAGMRVAVRERGFLGRSGVRGRIPLLSGRQVEEGRGRGVGRSGEVVMDEIVEGAAYELEGVDVSDVRFGKGETVVDGVGEGGAALAAESHRREIVDLGGGASH